jgi:hypothetical protein
MVCNQPAGRGQHCDGTDEIKPVSSHDIHPVVRETPNPTANHSQGTKPVPGAHRAEKISSNRGGRPIAVTGWLGAMALSLFAVICQGEVDSVHQEFGSRAILMREIEPTQRKEAADVRGRVSPGVRRPTKREHFEMLTVSNAGGSCRQL